MVCVRKCVHGCVCMGISLYRSEVDTKCLPLSLFTLRFEAGSLLKLELAVLGVTHETWSLLFGGVTHGTWSMLFWGSLMEPGACCFGVTDGMWSLLFWGHLWNVELAVLGSPLNLEPAVWEGHSWNLEPAVLGVTHGTWSLLFWGSLVEPGVCCFG